MGAPGLLSHAVESWAAYYSAHQLVSVVVRWFHIAGLVIGGGTAVTMDRQVLLARGAAPPQRAAILAAIHASHRVVVPALSMVALSGMLMAAADWTTFAGSRVFWTKMGLVALLGVNGAALVAAETTATRHDAPGAWTRLLAASAVSLLLWLLLLFMGLWLTAAA